MLFMPFTLYFSGFGIVKTYQAYPGVDSVFQINEFKNMYQAGDFYLSGQPTLEALRWLKKNGVTSIINLRSEHELKRYAEYAYDEQSVAKDLGLHYYSLPIRGQSGYTSENLDTIGAILEGCRGKALIHCANCGRVTYVMMAYLVKYHDYSTREAIEFGKKLTFSFPLEGLLGKEINISLTESMD